MNTIKIEKDMVEEGSELRYNETGTLYDFFRYKEVGNF